MLCDQLKIAIFASSVELIKSLLTTSFMDESMSLILVSNWFSKTKERLADINTKSGTSCFSSLMMRCSKL